MELEDYQERLRLLAKWAQRHELIDVEFIATTSLARSDTRNIGWLAASQQSAIKLAVSFTTAETANEVVRLARLFCVFTNDTYALKIAQTRWAELTGNSGDQLTHALRPIPPSAVNQDLDSLWIDGIKTRDPLLVAYVAVKGPSPAVETETHVEEQIKLFTPSGGLSQDEAKAETADKELDIGQSYRPRASHAAKKIRGWLRRQKITGLFASTKPRNSYDVTGSLDDYLALLILNSLIEDDAGVFQAVLGIKRLSPVRQDVRVEAAADMLEQIASHAADSRVVSKIRKR